MKKPYFHALLLVVLVALVAIGGLYGGQLFLHAQYPPHEHPQAGALDHYIHRHLELTAQQNEKLDAEEKGYLEHVSKLEGEMKRANKELADAIKQDGTYSSRVQKAMADNHAAMGELQKITIQHLFDMKSVLTPQQNEKLDRIVTDALTHAQP